MSPPVHLFRTGAALASGAVFGLGLAVAQMTNPRKVLDFLDVAGTWDASLMLVLGAACGLYGLAYRHLRQRAAPVLDTQFHWPAPPRIDVPLVAGSALFGVGWGLAGYCPGAAIASLGLGNPEALWVVPSLALGVLLHRVSFRLRPAPPPSRA